MKVYLLVTLLGGGVTPLATYTQLNNCLEAATFIPGTAAACVPLETTNSVVAPTGRK